MNINVYIYSTYDMDIYTLAYNGYPVNHMIKEALIGFANGNPIKFYLDEQLNPSFDVSKKGLRISVTIPDKEQNTINMLNAVKKGALSNFCKTIIRNSMIQQNIGCYFKENIFSEQQLSTMLTMNLGHDINSIRNLRLISSYPKSQAKHSEIKKKPRIFVPPKQQNTSLSNQTQEPVQKTNNPFSSIQMENKTSNSTTSSSNTKQIALDFEKRTLAPSLQAGNPYQQNTPNIPLQASPSNMSLIGTNPLPISESVLQSETQSNLIKEQIPQPPVTPIPINNFDDEDEYITNIDTDTPLTVANGNNDLFDMF